MCFNIIEEMTRSYNIVCMVRDIFFIFKLSVDLFAWHNYENIAKMANKISTFRTTLSYCTKITCRE